MTMKLDSAAWRHASAFLHCVGCALNLSVVLKRDSCFLNDTITTH